MPPEVQIGLVVAVATLLAGAIPALVTYAANRQTLRHEQRMRLRDERKAAYSRFLDAIDALADALQRCADGDPEGLPAARRALGAANSVLRLTADPLVDRAAGQVMRAANGDRDCRAWRERLKAGRRLFIDAARTDLGYGEAIWLDESAPVSTGSPRATQSLHEPG